MSLALEECEAGQGGARKDFVEPWQKNITREKMESKRKHSAHFQKTSGQVSDQHRKGLLRREVSWKTGDKSPFIARLTHHPADKTRPFVKQSHSDSLFCRQAFSLLPPIEKADQSLIYQNVTETHPVLPEELEKHLS